MASAVDKLVGCCEPVRAPAASADADVVVDAVDNVAAGIALSDTETLAVVAGAEVRVAKDCDVCETLLGADIWPPPARVDVGLAVVDVFGGTVSVLCVAVTALPYAEQIWYAATASP